MKATLRVVMIGGTGATGVPTVRGLLACPQLERLTLVCRKPRTDGTFPADARLEQLPVDFAAPLDASIFAGRNANCIISCFGTTKADTASQVRGVASLATPPPLASRVPGRVSAA